MKRFEAVVEWIQIRYGDAEKIVEVGIGNSIDVFLALSKSLPECELIATDVREIQVPGNLEFFIDDVRDPDLDIYEGADLLYSLRTPYELYSHILNLGREVDADVMVRPVSSEESPPWGELINHSGCSFYLWKSG